MQMHQLHQEMAVDVEHDNLRMSSGRMMIPLTSPGSGMMFASNVSAGVAVAVSGAAPRDASLLDCCSMTDDQKHRMILTAKQMNQHHHNHGTGHQHHCHNELAERNQLLIKRRDSINRNWKPFKSSFHGTRDRRLFKREPKPVSPTTPSFDPPVSGNPTFILSPTTPTAHQHHHHATVHGTQQCLTTATSTCSGLRRHHSMTGFRAGSLTESRIISSRSAYIPAHIPTPRNASLPSDSAAGTPCSPLLPMNPAASTREEGKKTADP